MSGKPYKDWEEVKKDIKKWHNINLGCIFFAALCLIGGVTAETLDVDLSIAPLSFYLLAIFLAVISIAPHIQVVALQSWIGVESEKK
jgi:hypothetical protein